jgi:hypothetical protein
MPRKQRFKPSRKPKPTPPTEEALNSHQTSSARPHNDNVDARESPPPRDQAERDEEVEPDFDQRGS